MSRSEVHIFWWNCDNHGCNAQAQVIGEGLPLDWWRLSTMVGKRAGLTFDEESLAFCSEDCAMKVRNILLGTQQGSRYDAAQDVRELLRQGSDTESVLVKP